MPSSPSDKSSVPLRWQRTPDGRSRGKAIQFARDYLAAHSKGVAREELQRIVRAHQGGRLLASPRSFARLLHGLRKGEEIAEVAGKIVPRRLARSTGGRDA